jgi:hypothetical protein
MPLEHTSRCLDASRRALAPKQRKLKENSKKLKKIIMRGVFIMSVLEFIVKNADKLVDCNTREEVYEACVKGGVDAPVSEFQASIKDMNFLYQVLKGIFDDGKMEEAKKLYATIKKVVETKAS